MVPRAEPLGVPGWGEWLGIFLSAGAGKGLRPRARGGAVYWCGAPQRPLGRVRGAAPLSAAGERHPDLGASELLLLVLPAPGDAAGPHLPAPHLPHPRGLCQLADPRPQGGGSASPLLSGSLALLQPAFRHCREHGAWKQARFMSAVAHAGRTAVAKLSSRCLEGGGQRETMMEVFLLSWRNSGVG